MGEVWRAEHHFLARPAAIKLIQPELLGFTGSSETIAAKQRFEREAQATAMLSSPHTINLYDFGVAEDGAFYYVMELLHGIDLETLVDKYGPLPAERVAQVLEQVCSSLEEAHQSGLVHRDIKPANILFVPVWPRLRLRQGARFRISQLHKGGNSAAEADASGCDCRDAWFRRRPKW